MTDTAYIAIADEEAEEYVLGAMMLSAHAIDVVREILEPSDFYFESHQHICRVAFDLHDIGAAVDAITVIDELRQRDHLIDVGGATGAEGGKQRIREIATLVPAATNAAHHAGIVARDARRRRQAAVGRHLTSEAYDNTNPDQIQAEAQAMLDELAGRDRTSRPRIVSAASFLADTEEPAIAAIGEPGETLLPLGGLLIMGGEGGASKTTLTLDGVAHMASGTPWLGYQICRPLQILIIENEGPRPQFREKLQAKVNSWTGNDWIPNVHVWEEPWASFSFAHDTDRRHLQDTAAELNIDFVVADPLDSLGIEGAGTPEDVRKFIAMLKKCGLHNPVKPLGFWILHHFNKGVGGSIVQRLSGAWGGHPDAIIGVELGDDQTTKLTWGKLRHATPPRDKTLMLAWDTDTRGFSPIEKTARIIDHDQLRQAVLEHVTSNPGQAQSAIENALHTDDRTRNAIRTALLHLTTEEGGKVLAVGKGPSPNGKYFYPASTLNSPLAEPLFEFDPSTASTEQLANTHGEYSQSEPGKPASAANSPLANTPNGEHGEYTPSLPGEEVLAARRPPPKGEASTASSPNGAERLTEQRAWITNGGWMTNDLDRELLTRFPTTGRYDLEPLRQHARECEQRELGVTHT